jgi:hypothetical protein
MALSILAIFAWRKTAKLFCLYPVDFERSMLVQTNPLEASSPPHDTIGRECFCDRTLVKRTARITATGHWSKRLVRRMVRGTGPCAISVSGTILPKRGG